MRITNYILWAMCSMTSIHAQTSPQSDQHFSHTDSTTADPTEVWNVWTNVPQWKDWDSGLQDAHLDEAFGLGARGTIVSLEGRKSTFIITEYNEGQSYVMKTNLPLGSLYVKRYLTRKDDSTSFFTHEVWFKGLTKGLFAKAFGAKFRKMLPEVLANIKQIAEK